MAKKKKKSVNRPSIVARVFRLLARGIGAIVRWTYRNARKNPLLAGGLAVFFIAFSVVSYNALFLQKGVHRSVFFETRTTIPAGNGSSIIEMIRNGSDTNQSFDPQLKAIQQKLTDLGLYDGDIDGLSGPKTRAAIENWQKLQQEADGNTGKPAKDDPIGSVIRDNAAEREIDRANITGSLRNNEVNKSVVDQTILEQSGVTPHYVSGANNQTENSADKVLGKADVMRIQAALRSFGNGTVIVNGNEDAMTIAGIRQFQAMFGLAETGKADHMLMNKMREVGVME